MYLGDEPNEFLRMEIWQYLETEIAIENIDQRNREQRLAYSGSSSLAFAGYCKHYSGWHQLSCASGVMKEDHSFSTCKQDFASITIVIYFICFPPLTTHRELSERRPWKASGAISEI